MSSFSNTLVDPVQRGTVETSRPSFSSQKTSDRLRESERRPSTPNTKVKPFRRSIFREELHLDTVEINIEDFGTESRSTTSLGHETSEEKKPITFDDILKDVDYLSPPGTKKTPLLSKLGRGGRPAIRSTASAPPGTLMTLNKITFIALLVAITAPGLLGWDNSANLSTADRQVIPKPS